MKLLEFRNVSKKFRNRTAVDNISFSVERGEVVALLGLNGAGKSTCFELAATLLLPDSGKIYFKEEDITEKPAVIREHLGYVPQEILLFEELSGKQNLEFWGKAYNLYGKELEEAVQRVIEIIGMKERVREKVANYSIGMKRRLNIGVAILHLPTLLILDEADVGMDILAVENIMGIIKTLNQEYGMTILYASHNMEETEQFCDRFLLLKDGKLLKSQKKEELPKAKSLKDWFMEQVKE